MGLEQVSERAENQKISSFEKAKGAVTRVQSSAYYGISGITGLPTERIMKRRVETYLQQEVKTLLKKAQRLERRLASGAAYELNEILKKVRALRSTIAQMVHATIEFIKELYEKYCAPVKAR